MSTYPIRNESDRSRVIKVIEGRRLPFTASFKSGAPRSIEQNKLQRLWMIQAAEQGDMTAEEYRAYCKLAFGVPLMCEHDEEYAAVYERVIKPLPYEDKLAIMAEPIDFPVTRRMTSGVKKQYLDRVYVHLTSLGFLLTQPGSLY